MTLWEFLTSPLMVAVLAPVGLALLICLLWAACEILAERRRQSR